MVIDMEEIVKELCPRTLQKKKAEGKRETVLQILEVKFGLVSQEIKDKLESITTAEGLEILVKGAVTAQTLEDFKKLL